MMKKSNNLWNVFLQTGRVEDYLSFRRAQDAEYSDEMLAQEEVESEYQDRWTRDS